MDESKQSSFVYDKIAKLYIKEFTKPSDYIDEFLNLLRENGEILDVGCGVGVDANYMASKGFKVIGIDLSKEMIKLAKFRFPKIKFALRDMRKLVFKPNSFDGIFVAYSLIHIPKRSVLSILKRLYKFLKTGGIIYIAVHTNESQEIFIPEPLKPDENIFLNIFSSEEIKKFLKNTKFSLLHQYQRKPKKKEEFNFTKLFILAKK